jgi:RNA polymerase sigma factor (sigma-70 family)
MAGVAHSVQTPFRRARMRGTLAPVAGLASRGLGADESALARRAAEGDGDAFAELYERHESRAFNLCYRILGSRDDAADATQEAFLGVLRRLPELADRDFAFGSYLLTSARNACYDLIERRKRTQPSDEIPESATPVGGGVGGGGTGFDPGDPEDDPERNVLLEARTEEIRLANLALPERQREVLALRELEDLSYDEIADLMDMNRNSVAQLISRARINLRDALRGTALASIAASSPDCERALPLIALEQDGQLGEDSNEAGWLGEHLMRCHTCRLGRDAMQEAGVSYRAWAPIAAGPLLFRETMAHAAELVGADWSDTIARREAKRGGAAAGASGSAPESARAAFRRHRRRDLTLIGVLTCLLVLVVLVGAASDDDPGEGVVPAAGAAEEEVSESGADGPGASEGSEKAAQTEAARRRRARARRARRNRAEAAAPVAEADDAAAAVPAAEPEPEPKPRRKRRRTTGNKGEGPGLGGQGEVERRPERGGQDVVEPETIEEPPAPPETTPEPPPPPTEPPPTGEPPRQPPTQPPPCSTPNCPRPPPP